MRAILASTATDWPVCRLETSRHDRGIVCRFMFSGHRSLTLFLDVDSVFDLVRGTGHTRHRDAAMVCAAARGGPQNTLQDRVDEQILGSLGFVVGWNPFRVLEGDPWHASSLDRLAGPRCDDGDSSPATIGLVGKTARQRLLEALDSHFRAALSCPELLEPAATLPAVSEAKATARVSLEFAVIVVCLYSDSVLARHGVVTANFWGGNSDHADHARHFDFEPAHSCADGAEPW